MAATNNKLIPIEHISETALGNHLSPWTVYRLIRDGRMPCVRLGRRVFVTHAIIDEFIARGGTAEVA